MIRWKSIYRSSRGRWSRRRGGSRARRNTPSPFGKSWSHTAGLRGGPPRSDTLEGYVQEIAQRPLEFEPGTSYKYSPGPCGWRADYHEVLSGIPYPQFLQQRLLDPLGLKETTFWPNAEQASRLALTYTLQPDDQSVGTPRSWSGQMRGTCRPTSCRSSVGAWWQLMSVHFGNPAGGLFSTATEISQILPDASQRRNLPGEEVSFPSRGEGTERAADGRFGGRARRRVWNRVFRANEGQGRWSQRGEFRPPRRPQDPNVDRSPEPVSHDLDGAMCGAYARATETTFIVLIANRPLPGMARRGSRTPRRSSSCAGNLFVGCSASTNAAAVGCSASTSASKQAYSPVLTEHPTPTPFVILFETETNSFATTFGSPL